MKRAIWSSLLFVLVSGEALAQYRPKPVIPANVDLEGTWLLLPAWHIPDRANFDRCDRVASAHTNYPGYGSSTVTLKAVERSVDERSSNLVMRYEGVIRYYQGYGRRGDAVDPENQPGVELVDYFCHVEPIDYRVSGEFVYPVGATSVEVSMSGEAIDPPPYQHGARAQFTGTALLTGEPIFFVDPTGTYGYGHLTTGPMVNAGVLPGNCDMFLNPEPESFSLSFCSVTGLRPWPFRRLTAPRVPMGRIRGRIVKGMPDGTPTADTSTTGTVRIYSQPAALRAQYPNESDSIYRMYVDNQRKSWSLLTTVRPDREGRFESPEVRSFDPIPNGRGLTLALYAVEVSDVEETEFVEDHYETTYYLTKLEPGLTIAQEKDVVVIPSSELSTKESLAINLRDRAPNNYGPVEEEVLTYLQPFIRGGQMPTDLQLDGVKRALWAERYALATFDYVPGLVETLLDPVANLAAALFQAKFSTKSKALKQAEEKLADLENQLEAARAKGMSARDTAGIRNNIENLHAENSSLAFAQPWTMVNRIFVPLFTALKSGLIKAGLPQEMTEKIVGFLQDKIFTLIGAIVTGERSGVYAEIIKEIIKQMKDTLVDSSIESFPSYARLTRGSLERSRDMMMDRRLADEDRFRADRERVVESLSEFHRGMYKYQYALAWGPQLISEWAGNASDVFGLIPAPQAQLAEKISKIVRYLADVGTISSAFTAVFVALPLNTSNGVDLAFGLSPLRATALPGFGPLVTANPAIPMAYNDAYGRVLDRFQALDRAIDAGFDLDTLASEAEQTRLVLADFNQKVELALGQVAGAYSTDGRLHETALAAQIAYVEMRTRQTMLFTALEEMLLAFATGEHIVRSAGYDAAIERTKAALVGLELQIEQLGMAVYAAGATDPMLEVLPVIAIEDLEITSELTNQRSITQTPERFTISARIRNVSTASVGAIRPQLRVNSATGAVALIAGADQMPFSLAADDAVEGSDEIVATWTIEYRGALDGVDDVAIQLDLVEDDHQPRSFVSLTTSALLLHDPSVRDTDDDGLFDGWERAHGLDPTRDDSEMDLDADGLTNGDENVRGLAPDRADTDGDGLSDGEELTPGSDGFSTDPIVADTDGDGIDDARDGDPANGTSTAPAPSEETPRLEMDQSPIALSVAKRVELRVVRNAGGSTLTWTAVSDNPAIRVSPTPPVTGEAGGPLIVWALVSDPNQVAAQANVRVVNLSGGQPEIRLEVSTGLVLPGDAGVIGEDGGGIGEDGGVGGGRDAGGTTGPEEEGCGCTVSTRDRSGSYGFVMLAVAALWARRIRSGAGRSRKTTR
jgi:hypothetical protein